MLNIFRKKAKEEADQSQQIMPVERIISVIKRYEKEASRRGYELSIQAVTEKFLVIEIQPDQQKAENIPARQQQGRLGTCIKMSGRVFDDDIIDVEILKPGECGMGSDLLIWSTHSAQKWKFQQIPKKFNKIFNEATRFKPELVCKWVSSSEEFENFYPQKSTVVPATHQLNNE